MTVVFGIHVASAIGDFLILDAVRSRGGAVAVSDEAILAELADCARHDGAFFIQRELPRSPAYDSCARANGSTGARRS